VVRCWLLGRDQRCTAEARGVRKRGPLHVRLGDRVLDEALSGIDGGLEFLTLLPCFSKSDLDSESLHFCLERLKRLLLRGGCILGRDAFAVVLRCGRTASDGHPGCRSALVQGGRRGAIGREGQ
jgi:hypothetical protein